ncbi:MAG: hypothetical protein R3265_16750 [Hyphomonas sp.]|nr:hypothetical protein [Hyphomonas sp.]
MNPYERFRTVSGLLAASLVLAGIVAFGPVVRHLLFTAAGDNAAAQWGMLSGATLILLVMWSVLAGVILPGVLKTGMLRRLVLGRAYVEGSWIQAERGGPNGPRIAIVSLKPARNGVLLSSSTLTRMGEIESGLQAEFHQLTWPRLDFKFRETLPSDSGRQAEGFGEIQFDLTGGAPRRYSGCLQLGGTDKRIKTEAIKLTSWKERRQLRSLDGRRDVLSKYWSAFFEGPIVTAARDDVEPRSKGSRKSGKVEVLRQRDAKDWRKSDTTPTADRIRDEFSASAD